MKKYGIFALVMLLGGSAALATTFAIPFFRSVTTGTDQSLAFIGVKNLTTGTVVVSGTYTALDVSDVAQNQTFTFTLGPLLGLSWEPLLDDAGIEGTVPAAIQNMTHQARLTGSVTLASPGAIAGRYVELKTVGNHSSAFAHVALPL